MDEFDKYFEELKEQVKIIDIKEYNKENEDNFQRLRNYWEDIGLNRLKQKIQQNKARISYINSLKD